MCCISSDYRNDLVRSYIYLHMFIAVRFIVSSWVSWGSPRTVEKSDLRLPGCASTVPIDVVEYMQIQNKWSCCYILCLTMLRISGFCFFLVESRLVIDSETLEVLCRTIKRIM